MAIPADHEGELPGVEQFFTGGTLVWPSGARVACPSLEAAQLGRLLLMLGWSGPLPMPLDRSTASELHRRLDEFVDGCSVAVKRELQALGVAGAQLARVLAMVPSAIGRRLFSPVESVS